MLLLLLFDAISLHDLCRARTNASESSAGDGSNDNDDDSGEAAAAGHEIGDENEVPSDVQIEALDIWPRESWVVKAGSIPL